MPFQKLPQEKCIKKEIMAFTLRLYREHGMQETEWVQFRLVDLLSKPDFQVKGPTLPTKGANWQNILTKNPQRFGRLRNAGKDFIVRAANAYMPNDPDQVPIHWIIQPLLTTTNTLGSLSKKAGLQPLTSIDQEAQRVLEVTMALCIHHFDEDVAMKCMHSMFSLAGWLMAQAIDEWQFSIRLGSAARGKHPTDKFTESLIARWMMDNMLKTLNPPYKPGDAEKRLFGEARGSGRRYFF